MQVIDQDISLKLLYRQIYRHFELLCDIVAIDTIGRNGTAVQWRPLQAPYSKGYPILSGGTRSR